jgi:hypothetical protein
MPAFWNSIDSNVGAPLPARGDLQRGTSVVTGCSCKKKTVFYFSLFEEFEQNEWNILSLQQMVDPD